jgi:hypothetical protein
VWLNRTTLKPAVPQSMSPASLYCCTVSTTMPAQKLLSQKLPKLKAPEGPSNKA